MPEDKIRRSVPVIEGETDTTKKPEILDYAARHQELFEEFQNGELTAEEYKEMVDVLFKSAGEEKGTIPKGETVTGKENFDNPVPLSVNDEGYTERYVRTVLEGGQLNEDMLHTIKQQILSGEFAYKPTSNEANMEYAKRAIEKNTAESIWDKAINGNGLPSKNEIAIGEALLKNAIAQGDTVKVVKYTAELADVGTRLGQRVLDAYNLDTLDIDSDGNNSYNGTVENANVGGGENAIHQQRGMDENKGEYRAVDSGRKGETRRTWQESKEAFASRSEGTSQEDGRTGRVLLKHGNAQMAYTSAEAETIKRLATEGKADSHKGIRRILRR